mmetsp:Transcript_7581/g.24923  ORF Transcript_7581/g.24923 Transcript_7581/m.24923 type:complete len:311 (-) Transcript_7581:894-1826(-)
MEHVRIRLRRGAGGRGARPRPRLPPRHVRDHSAHQLGLPDSVTGGHHDRRPESSFLVRWIVCAGGERSRWRLAGSMGHNRRRPVLLGPAQHTPLHIGSGRCIGREAAGAAQRIRAGARGLRHAPQRHPAPVGRARLCVRASLLAARLNLDALLRCHHPGRVSGATRSAHQGANHPEALPDRSVGAPAGALLCDAHPHLPHSHGAGAIRSLAALPSLHGAGHRRQRAQLGRLRLAPRRRHLAAPLRPHWSMFGRVGPSGLAPRGRKHWRRVRSGWGGRRGQERRAGLPEGRAGWRRDRGAVQPSHRRAQRG